MKTEINTFLLNIKHTLSDIRGPIYLHLRKVYFFMGHQVSFSIRATLFRTGLFSPLPHPYERCGMGGQLPRAGHGELKLLGGATTRHFFLISQSLSQARPLQTISNLRMHFITWI